MHMRAGRKAGRADKADDLALAHLAADIEAARESGHVAVGGLIAVGMAQAHIFAVAALEPDLVDRCRCRRQRSACRRAPPNRRRCASSYSAAADGCARRSRTA